MAITGKYQRGCCATDKSQRPAGTRFDGGIQPFTSPHRQAQAPPRRWCSVVRLALGLPGPPVMHMQGCAGRLVRSPLRRLLGSELVAAG